MALVVGGQSLAVGRRQGDFLFFDWSIGCGLGCLFCGERLKRNDLCFGEVVLLFDGRSEGLVILFEVF